MMKLKERNCATSFDDFKNYDDNFSEIEDENTASQDSFPKDSFTWDTFAYYPLKRESASMQNKKWANVSIHIIKVLVYGILFCTVFCSSLISKIVVLFAVSQLEENKTVQFCDSFSEYYGQISARISKRGRIIWTWCLIFMFLVPEVLAIFQAVWYFLFKKKRKLPTKRSIAILFILETLYTIGIALLVFYSFPRLSSVDAAAISSCICFIPALLNLLFQYRKHTNTTMTFLLVLACNIFALVAQGSGLFLQSFLNYNVHDPLAWILPIALILSSARWWCNYVPHTNYCGFMKFLTNTKTDLINNCYVLRGCVAFWRCFVFVLSAILISLWKGINIQEFFEYSWNREYRVELITNSYIFYTIVNNSAPLNSFLIQAFCSFLVYKAGKFAYQTHMHQFGFALPISLVTPGTICLILIFTRLREQNSCAFHDVIPDYLFLNSLSYPNVIEVLLNWRLWCWLMWWLSQVWITSQLWLGENERIAPTKMIFQQSSYDTLLIDQFLGLNKRKHEINNIIEEEEEEQVESTPRFETRSLKESHMFNDSYLSTYNKHISNRRNPSITQIYACATMWHETKEEMSEFIESILRLDKDQCAMKVTQKYYKIYIKDYYELETHIMFDDAFCCMHGCTRSCDHDENEAQVNEYVITFVEAMQENITKLGVLASLPIKCPTPYGGQLIWNLPGKTRLTVHLKNKNKIRHRKRWSQVMYMYYLLGHRLMDSSIDVDTKEIIAENTYILTLDGDIDFRPAAIKSLIDLMKQDRELGAACGRIHPIGNGPIVWFQKFEYAIGHWLQKSAEHTLGSVLCCPGCFSLFRAKALMQNNVIAKYALKSTEPRHYIQYDQGEDRWLCTLILQAGCRVAYSAAGDAYTHAPESFKEFYNQRRRWIPSTMANIFDLLGTSREIRQINNNISWLYVTYQWILTGSTIIGPSFIYLMMVGAFVTSFELGNWQSFWYNSIPITIFILTCFFCKVHMQLIVAGVLTIIYALVMMVVLVGMTLQIAQDGFVAPNALLFFIVLSQFVLAAFLHPQEISCLPHGFIYYITVPSMYMLLIIFSIFNVHNITWGTRETKSAGQLKSTENKSSPGEHSENVENKETKFSLSNLFTCSFCTYKKSTEEDKHLKTIYDSINEMNIHLKEIESKICNVNNTLADDTNEKCNSQDKIYNEQVKWQVKEDSETSTDSEVEISEQIYSNDRQEYSNYLVNPYWLQDVRLKSSKVDFLSNSEEKFWKQLIQKYLHPIDDDMEIQKKIAKGLINIRNECLLKFFIINTLFIVAIFLLQMNKDVLHVQWPFNVEYNITYVDEYEVHIFRKYMHLEPIGCLFIVAFVLILLTQFLAMLVHQCNTLTHILANIKLTIPFLNKEKYLLDDLVSSEHAKNIAEGLQNATHDDAILNLNSNVMYSSGKRKTVKELIEDSKNLPKIPPNFEVLFHKTLRNPTTSGFSRTVSSTVPKGVMEEFEKRRSHIVTEHNKCQTQNNVHILRENEKLPNRYMYDNPTFTKDE